MLKNINIIVHHGVYEVSIRPVGLVKINVSPWQKSEIYSETCVTVR